MTVEVEEILQNEKWIFWYTNVKVWRRFTKGRLTLPKRREKTNHLDTNRKRKVEYTMKVLRKKSKRVPVSPSDVRRGCVMVDNKDVTQGQSDGLYPERR